MIFISHHTSCLPRTPEVCSSKYRESKTNFTLRALHHPTHKTAQIYWQKTAGDSFVFIFLMCTFFKQCVNDALLLLGQSVTLNLMVHFATTYQITVFRVLVL